VPGLAVTEVERFIRIQNLFQSPGKADPEWRTLPNANRVRVWDMGNVDALADEAAEDGNSKRFIFHIAYLDGISRGCRVSYMGTNFRVLSVSDSTRLRGLELRCAPTAD
jgi:hypothetical protein